MRSASVHTLPPLVLGRSWKKLLTFQIHPVAPRDGLSAQSQHVSEHFADSAMRLTKEDEQEHKEQNGMPMGADLAGKDK